MWWIAIPVGIGLGLKLISDVISEEERSARRSWETARVRVERSLDEHKRNIETHLHQAQSSYDFHFLTDLHYSSVKTANLAYKSFNDAKLSLQGINKMLVSANQQRAQYQQTLEQAKANKNKALIHDTITELKSINEMRKNLFQDRDNVKQQLNQLLEKVQQLNSRTYDLKQRIKTSCGKGGQLWYQRLEAKKQQKRLAQGH